MDHDPHHLRSREFPFAYLLSFEPWDLDDPPAEWRLVRQVTICSDEESQINSASWFDLMTGNADVVSFEAWTAHGDTSCPDALRIVMEGGRPLYLTRVSMEMYEGLLKPLQLPITAQDDAELQRQLMEL